MSAANPSPAAPASARSRLVGLLRRPWFRCLLYLVGGYLFIVIAMLAFERSFIFFPMSEGDWEPDWLEFEDARFTAADGTQLHGWYLEHPEARQAIVFAHGNAGNVALRAQRFARMRKLLGVSILAFDYRGYGKSAGVPDEAGVIADARAARAWLAQRTGRNESDLVLMGESLGGAVMVELAGTDGARGLILENTFTSLADVAAHHYRWLPVRWLMRTRFDSVAAVANYDGPLLQCHAEVDEIIPPELGRQLFEAAGSRQKRFVWLPGQLHNDDTLSSREYIAALRTFLASLPTDGPGHASREEQRPEPPHGPATPPDSDADHRGDE